MGKDEGHVNPNFMARVTQHIPEKGFQIVRYYAAGIPTGQKGGGARRGC